MSSLLYIHGFLSSPQSGKVQQLKQWLHDNRPDIGLHCPHLPPYPRRAQMQLEALVEFLRPEPVGLIGSSLGGFWATWLAEKYDLPAVLINPSVAPWEFMPDYLGREITGYHTDDRYCLEPHHIDEVHSAAVPELKHPEHYWLLVQTGDQTLDYRNAVEKYAGCKQTVEPGGSHAFDNFEARIPEIVGFLAPR